MKRTILVFALIALVGLGGQAFADLDTIDNVPAATLLIPYFQVDVSEEACEDSTGLTTLFSVNNASAASQVAHITVWTDQSVPALDFDIYLTGFDVQTFNVRDFFCSGDLPRTGPNNAVSNHGTYSDPPPPPAVFPSCSRGTVNGNNPVWGPGAIVPSFAEHLRRLFTGRPSQLTGNCGGSGQLGDDIAVGYITVDDVNDCTPLLPPNPGYFGAGGVVTFDNVFWGDWFLVDEVNNFSQGFSAVHIEAADPTDTVNAYLPGEHTFYGRYVAANASDQREPLPTTMAARFAAGGQFDGTVYYIWREANQLSSEYPCIFDGPAWHPLSATNNTGGGAVIVFNEREEPITPGQGPSGPPPVIVPIPPNETNYWVVGPGGDYDTASFNFGWVYQNLQHPDIVYPDIFAQQWTAWSLQASGRFSVGLDAVQLDTANNPVLVNPGP